MKRFYIIMCLTLLATFSAWAQVPQKGTKAYEYYQKAITGDAHAQYLLGREYEKQNDYVSAVNWYRKAAEQGHIAAQTELGICYSRGNGVPQDHAEAAKWFSKANEQFQSIQGSNLDSFGNSGSSSNSNGSQASSSSQNSNSNDKIPPKGTKAYEYYQKAITGDTWAQTKLGNEFYKSKDFENAIYWFSKAAEQGNEFAKIKLGLCYSEITLAAKNPAEAIKRSRKAAAQGNEKAKDNLNSFGNSGSSSSSNGLQASSSSQPRNKYSDFTGKIPAKGTEAYGYYEKAITGDAEAQNSLGDKYYNSKEYSSAVYWYRKAAEQGHPYAQCNLGYCYEYGQGVTKSITEAVKWYRKAAEQGNAAAQYNLGECYEKGKGVTKDYYETVKWYRKAADQGIAEAEYNLGVCYEKGQGVTKSISEAEKWYRKAAAQGNTNAKDNLKRLSSSGSTGLQANSSSQSRNKYSDFTGKIPAKGTEAYGYYQKAITGDAVAQNSLGDKYYNSKDYSSAVFWYRIAAEQGFDPAQFNLGSCYANGRGVTPNKNEAVKWYRKAAEKGHAKAQCMLGVHYERGFGVTRDINEAVRWYRKAAAEGNAIAKDNLKRLGYSESSSGSTGLQASSRGKNSSSNDKIPPKGTDAYSYYKEAITGDAEAQKWLGDCYYYGEEVTKDYYEAAKWYRKAAEQGYPDAQTDIGVCYYFGQGVTKDYYEAAKWYRKAAEQGDINALCLLGRFYEIGIAVPQNITEAVKWYRKAAEQGDSWAQHELGKCYEKGKGVNKNINEAVKWYRKSAENGNTFAIKALEDLGYSK